MGTGAIYFPMTDIYGGYAGTTETTVPEANDQTALVDDQKAAANVTGGSAKKFPMLGAVLAILVLAILMGAFA